MMVYKKKEDDAVTNKGEITHSFKATPCNQQCHRIVSIFETKKNKVKP